jgi:predicted metal-dependent hydrolase
MSTEHRRISINGLRIEIVRKDIKNLHLGVYPPNGRVRVATPLRVNDDAVRLAVIGKLGWIKRQRTRFDGQPRQSEREMVSGESHYLLGRRYRLNVIEHNGPSKVVLRRKTTIDLYVRPKTTAVKRDIVLQRWYRQQLAALVPPLMNKWQPIVGMEAAHWSIRKMKTKWGSCNTAAGRIWLNLELVKKPVRCLEYIMVHELVHLLERYHNDKFLTMMNTFLPQWRSRRIELNAAPLAHATWNY